MNVNELDHSHGHDYGNGLEHDHGNGLEHDHGNGLEHDQDHGNGNGNAHGYSNGNGNAHGEVTSRSRRGNVTLTGGYGKLVTSRYCNVTSRYCKTHHHKLRSEFLVLSYALSPIIRSRDNNLCNYYKTRN